MKLVNIHFVILFLLLLLFGVNRNGAFAQNMTLQQCTEVAVANNKNLLVLRNNLQLAEQKKQEALSNRLPKITATGDYKFFTNLPYQLMPLSTFNPAAPEGEFKEAQFGVPHNLGLNVQAAMPIYNPQIKTGVQGTVIASELGYLQVEKSEEQVVFEVANLYYNAQILQQQLLFVDSNLVNANRLFATMQLLHSQGLAKGTDVGKIELQQSQLQSQRLQLESKLAQVFNGLNFFMGKELDAPLSVPIDIATAENNAYSVSTSVDLRLSQAQNRLLINELELIEKTKLPTVSLVAHYGLTGFGYLQQPEPFVKIFPIGFIGVQANYPIWNKTNRFRIAQKEVEINGNRLQSEQIQAQNDLQIANAMTQKNAAQANISTSQKQIDLAKSVYLQTLVQQRQGTAMISDILLADNALREAQVNYLNVLVEYLKADLELKKASGSIKK
ncbi:MAG: TolC family protein [Saprospiraceae bacterium]